LAGNDMSDSQIPQAKRKLMDFSGRAKFKNDKLGIRGLATSTFLRLGNVMLKYQSIIDDYGMALAQDGMGISQIASGTTAEHMTGTRRTINRSIVGRSPILKGWFANARVQRNHGLANNIRRFISKFGPIELTRSVIS